MRHNLRHLVQTEKVDEPSNALCPTTTPEQESTARANYSDVYLPYLEQSVRKTKRRKLFDWGISLGAIICAILPAFFPNQLSIQFSLLSTFIFLLVVQVSLQIYRHKVTRKKPGFSDEDIAAVKVPEDIGRLIDLTTTNVGSFLPPLYAKQDDHRFHPLLETLSTALLQLRPQDGIHISADQREILSRTLVFGSTMRSPSSSLEKYFLAILKSLEAIGDDDGLRLVTHIASRNARSEFQHRLVSAAKQCESVLQARLIELRDSRTLLRPSAVQEDEAALLLRPVPFSPEANPDLLLRVAKSKQPNT